MSIFETTLILVALRNNIRVFLWHFETTLILVAVYLYSRMSDIYYGANNNSYHYYATATEKTISPLHSLTQHDCLFKREPYSRVDHYWRRRIDLPD